MDEGKDMQPAPLFRPTRLADGRVHPPAFIPATIIRHFPVARLPEVEAAWSPARRELADALQVSETVLESSHWNWKAKMERIERGDLRLFALECEEAVQGLMAIPDRPRPSVLTPGESIVYVDYLESAPWNQIAPGRSRRFGGAGSALVIEAIVVSAELGLQGRVGLHSLPQSERFYADKFCMTRVGPDPTYNDLVYFEYSDGAGADWLAEQGTIT
jgi:hypothetical protein